jgi:hypothetical protein
MRSGILVSLAVHAPDAPAAGDPVSDPEEPAKALKAAARALLGAVTRGRGCAFDSAAAAGARLLRMGYAPFVGRAAARKALRRPGRLSRDRPPRWFRARATSDILRASQNSAPEARAR